MPRVLIAAAAFAVAASFSACASGATRAPSQPGAAPVTAAGPPAGQSNQVVDRLLVRHASVTVDVSNPDTAAKRIRDIAARMNGYVERERRADRMISITIRVPEPSTGAVLDSVGRLGKLDKRTMSTDDVTSEVVDLDARLVTLVAMRDRLRKLLERAEGIPDVITVERELTRVQEQIDLIEARLKFLRGSAAMAEIDVTARKPESPGIILLALQGMGWIVDKVLF